MLGIFFGIIVLALVGAPLFWWLFDGDRRRSRLEQERKTEMTVRAGRRAHNLD